jgi:excisionase family DNA binding protein
MQDDLTVTEAAEALGASKQTVRALLRKGELHGRKQAWGNRYVWVPSRQGVDEFLSQYGRLDGRRRSRASQRRRADEHGTIEIVPSPGRVESPTLGLPYPLDSAPASPVQRPLLLRPRVRATVFLLVVGLPLIAALAAAEILPAALWFDELGQLEVFRSVVAAKVTLYVLASSTASFFVGANLAVVVSRTLRAGSGSVALGIAAASLVTGTFFGAAAAPHWEAFLLWRHRQSFGITDPMFGKDVGFFVFSLPFELLLSTFLLWLIVVAGGFAAVVYRARGALTFRPLRANSKALSHLSLLAGGFFLVVSWRLLLERYELALAQPRRGDSQTFAGAQYVAVHVQSPGLVALSGLAAVLAFACIAAPFVSRRTSKRSAVVFVAIPSATFLIAAVSISSWIPALVQRFAVNPNPLLSERPYLMRSIAATRSGLGIDSVTVVPYSPTGELTSEEVSEASTRSANVLIWDQTVVHARMLDLVTQTPYYRPDEPTIDAVPVDGQPQPTMASARQLDISRVRGQAETWTNDRLAYTHGLGLVRFSGTGIDEGGQPVLLDEGLNLRQPRIYFGDFPRSSPSWIVANSRRPEVDIPTADGGESTEYHYDGAGGIAISSWVRRAVFALRLGSKDLLLSDDITSESRLLLHRDVNNRLRSLAPFIQWDSQPAALAAGDRILFAVAGYTTSENYPYAEDVELGSAQAGYARFSVVATVDAFSGRVDLYRTDDSDPIVRAWAESFPTLFRPASALPAELAARLRYPADLFDAQASAYERFHATQPAVFASESDAWSRPTGLSGPVEVAGDIHFDEDDEDDLRHRLDPGYKYSAPLGQERPQIVRSTYYSPRRGQNLVASLEGWVDERGRPHLASQALARDPITLGPAQVSRLVFSTPRVRNLLGLRNLEVRDLDTSSIDSVSLGTPHLVFLPSGVLQIQSLYEGASGPGVSRLLGVTAFLNGSAGLGPDIEAAVRQALNRPPRIDVLRPSGPFRVGTPVDLVFRVRNAQRELITITSSAGREDAEVSLSSGRGGMVWVPTAPGHARIRVQVDGLDGTTRADTISLPILSPPPTIRLFDVPTAAMVGRPVRMSFAATGGLRQTVRVSTRGGVFMRRYLIHNGTGFFEWTPRTTGPVVIRVTTQGHQGQTATDTLKLTVGARQPGAPTSTPIGMVPGSVSVPIERANVALARAEARFAQHRYGLGLNALEALRRAAGEAHQAAVAQIGKPPTDPESDEPPGPPAVLAVINLEHRIGMRIPAIFNGMRSKQVVHSLQDTLWTTHLRRDRMLDIVIALNQEGAGADYADGMADTLPAFNNEVITLQNGLGTYVLTASGRVGVANALERARATRDRVNDAFGGGE